MPRALRPVFVRTAQNDHASQRRTFKNGTPTQLLSMSTFSLLVGQLNCGHLFHELMTVNTGNVIIALLVSGGGQLSQLTNSNS
jgi:hypothetical protein